jgi:hypothetical protein
MPPVLTRKRQCDSRVLHVGYIAPIIVGLKRAKLFSHPINLSGLVHRAVCRVKAWKGLKIW